VRELTCDEREGYQVEPFCDESGKSPMSTPYSTWTPSPTATMTPTPDLTRTTATLTATDTPTLLPSSTNTPTMTPVSAQIVNPGAYRGEIAIGGGQLWTYEGQAGETLIVQVNADNPAGTNTDAQTRLSRGLLDTYVVLYGPDHSILTEGDDIDAADPERTNSMIDYELPVDGSYNIEVRSFNSESGGQYTLVIESRGLAAITPVVTMSPIRAPMETAAP
jgi:hypothetical protein